MPLFRNERANQNFQISPVILFLYEITNRVETCKMITTYHKSDVVGHATVDTDVRGSPLLDSLNFRQPP
jgi:hypothetical protein